MENTGFSKLRCKYCGQNLKEEFSYDDRTCSTVYSCDCGGAKRQKELEEAIKEAKNKVAELEQQLQQHKASSLYNKQYNEIMNELYNLEHKYHDIGKVEMR